MVDDAIIQMLMVEQKRSKRQATCAVNALKRFGYGPVDRFHMLKDPNNNIHLLSYFGNIWIFMFLVFFFLAIAVYSSIKVISKFFFEYLD